MTRADIAPGYIEDGVYYAIRCPGWPVVRAADMEDAQIAAETMEHCGPGRFPDGLPIVNARYVQEEVS